MTIGRLGPMTTDDEARHGGGQAVSRSHRATPLTVRGVRARGRRFAGPCLGTRVPSPEWTGYSDFPVPSTPAVLMLDDRMLQVSMVEPPYHHSRSGYDVDVFQLPM